MLETRCRCKIVQRSKRKQQTSLKKKEWVPKVFVFGFQMGHGNGEDNWLRFDASTKQDQLRISMATAFKVRQFLSFL